MTVDSYLELFTTLYGWALAGVFRDILVDTGVIYAPFALILGETWLESHKSSSYEGADAAWMVRVMEAELLTAFVVISLCFVPLVPLSAVGLRHTPAAHALNPNPVTATAANPDSSGYAAAFPNPPASIDIPVWWYGVMGFSAGFNEATRGGVAGATSNLAVAENLAQNLSIADPVLRNEMRRFYNECFVPARTRYLNGTTSPATQAAIASHGQGDIDWIGSHAFRDEPALYGRLRASAEVPGFALQLAGDDVDMALNDIKPDWSRPNCLRWWTDPQNGLQQRSIAGADSGAPLLQFLATTFPALLPDRLQDALSRAVEKANVAIIENAGVAAEDRGIADSVADFFQRTIGGVGVVGEGWKAWASAPMIILFAQTVQPLILLAIYMFLPLVLVIGRFSFRVMFLGALAIFTVKGWSAMWFIANWLYDHMLVAMYPSTLGLLHALLKLNLDESMKRIVLNTTLIAMYLGFPLIWTSMLAWVGYQVAGAMGSAAKGSIATGAAAGAAGARMGSQVAGSAAGAASRGITKGLGK